MASRVPMNTIFARLDAQGVTGDDASNIVYQLIEMQLRFEATPRYVRKLDPTTVAINGPFVTVDGTEDGEPRQWIV